MPTFYDYPATLHRVVDGDTVDLAVSQHFDFGFHVSVAGAAVQKFRLARVNAPEMPTVAGAAAKLFVEQWLADHADGLRVTSKGQDKYGRWIGEIYDVLTSANLSDALLASGNAVPYH